MWFREALRKAKLYFVRNRVRSGSSYREYRRPLIAIPSEISRVFPDNTEFFVFYNNTMIILTKEKDKLIQFPIQEKSSKHEEILRDFREFICIVDILFNEFTDRQLIRIAEKYPEKLEKLKHIKKKYLG